VSFIVAVLSTRAANTVSSSVELTVLAVKEADPALGVRLTVSVQARAACVRGPADELRVNKGSSACSHDEHCECARAELRS
jgi:hypothetical protein